MKKQAILIVLASVVLTSLIWILVLDYYKIDLASLGNRQNTISNTTNVEEIIEEEHVAERPTKQSSTKKSTDTKAQTSTSETISNEENLSPIGYWVPVETSEYIVEISKYNALKIRSKQVSDVVFEDYTYKISGNKITYSSDYGREGSFYYKVSKSGNKTYLEIYDNPKYAGKYRKR